MKKVSAIVYHEHGKPEDVLQVEEKEIADLQPHEVLVEMKAAPINPADLNMIEGKYAIRPELPAVPGTEGAGVVVATGSAVRELKTGTLVLPPNSFGSWREAGVVAADKLIVVPEGISPEQAAMLKVNPPTAWRMLHDVVTLNPGNWVLQNAANSGVGVAVIQIAKTLGLRTLNVVRRPELIDELKDIGADVVVCDSDELPKQIAGFTGGAKIMLALNAVGGESALHLANSLGRGGTIVTYGAMSRQPLRIPNGLLIFKDLRWRGFWVTQWYQQATKAERDEMFAHLFPLAERGILKTKIEKAYPIQEVKQAIGHAQQGGRAGKILFEFNAVL